MRILLLEDDDAKAKRIEKVLLDTAGKSTKLITVKNVADARNQLDADYFDLLILDIRVPFRDGEQADNNGGIHLLKELLEDEKHKRPRYVVGISGVDDLYEDSNRIFLAHGWALFRYSPTTPEWADSLRYFVNHIICLEQTDVHHQVKNQPNADVVIITALENPEFRYLKSVFPELKGPRPLDSKTLIWEGELQLSTGTFRVVAGHCWQMGLTASSLFMERLITKFNPKLIAMTGICAGYPDSVELGDVIIATQSWEWQGGKIIEGEGNQQGLLAAPESYRASQELIATLTQLKINNSEILDVLNRYVPEDADMKWNIHFGPVVSGLSVVSSKKAMNEIRLQHRKILGLEMEAYAIYAAANFHPANPASIVIKGVCDFGDASKANGHQRIGSLRSAVVLRALIESFLKN